MVSSHDGAALPWNECAADRFHEKFARREELTMKKAISAAIAVATLTLGASSMAEARSDFNVYLGAPGGSYGGGFYGPGYGPSYGFYDDWPYRRRFHHRSFRP
jgi:hypothetical protein